MVANETRDAGHQNDHAAPTRLPRPLATLPLGKQGLRLAALLALASPGKAAVLDDYLAHGYQIVAATVLPGSFGGCVARRRLVLADGSVFSCAATSSQVAFGPRVVILRLGADAPSVALIGSQPYPGELLRLRGHDYPVPLRMGTGVLADAPAPPAALKPVSPVRAVLGIDAIVRQSGLPLSQQQDRPLPVQPKPGGRGWRLAPN